MNLRPQRHLGHVPEHIENGTRDKEAKLTGTPPSGPIGSLMDGLFDDCHDLGVVGKSRM
ncbi:hypothetical protein [Bradyrhizobium cytisi]|uniref:hypothetical protein n=1 Tax=Bradyrhizobium cytisi TaxID=515489 RepID=UPI001652C06E|nr:hypothetical protein [Bradyrhizobium cytisi]